MKKYFKYILFITISIGALFFSCKKQESGIPSEETILQGKSSFLVDESLLPIVENQLEIFESRYNAKITLIPQSEKESILSLAHDKAKVIVLSRELNPSEENVFKQKKIIPRSTRFAIDAIAFIKNKQSNDSLIDLKEILDFVKGSKNQIKGLVFDNPNSSTVRYICEKAGINELPQSGIYSFKTNDDVIKYVSKNEGMIGVVGINWVSQPKKEMLKYKDEITVLSVKAINGKEYVYPSQDNIGTKKYPLARDLYIINCQGYEGLGMGFASFIAGELGQRIIMQSGIAPIREPSRNIRIRNQIEKK